MRSALIVAAMAIVGAAAIWSFAGRQLVLILDRISLTRVQSKPAGPFSYAPGGMTIGDYALESYSPDGRQADLRVDVDASGLLVLHAGGKSFPLGARIGAPDESGRPDIPFAPDPGDDVEFSVERSLVGWPTPFEMNFMTGQAPSRRRNVYFRLAWRKRSGAALAMLWRYEQEFHVPDGWSASWSTQERATGLVQVSIVEGATPGAESAEAYLMRTKGWARGDYRLEGRGISADGCCAVVWVIRRLDEPGARPGGGRPAELRINRITHRINEEPGPR